MRFTVSRVMDMIERRLTTDVALAQAVVDVGEIARYAALDGGRSISLVRIGMAIDALGRYLFDAGAMVYPVAGRELLSEGALTSKERMVLGRWADDGLIEVTQSVTDRVPEVADFTGLPLIVVHGCEQYASRFGWLRESPERSLWLRPKAGGAVLTPGGDGGVTDSTGVAAPVAIGKAHVDGIVEEGEPDDAERSSETSSREDAGQEATARDAASRHENARDEKAADEARRDERTRDENAGGENAGGEARRDERTRDENAGDENAGGEARRDERTRDENAGDENAGGEARRDEKTRDENAGDKARRDENVRDEIGRDGAYQDEAAGANAADRTSRQTDDRKSDQKPDRTGGQNAGPRDNQKTDQKPSMAGKAKSLFNARRPGARDGGIGGFGVFSTRGAVRVSSTRVVDRRFTRTDPSGIGTSLLTSEWRCLEPECPAFGGYRRIGQPVPRMPHGVPVCPRHGSPLRRIGPRPAAFTMSVVVDDLARRRFVVDGTRPVVVGRAPSDPDEISVGSWLHSASAAWIGESHLRLRVQEKSLIVTNLSDNGTLVWRRSSADDPGQTERLYRGDRELGEWDSLELYTGVELVPDGQRRSANVTASELGSVLVDAPTVVMRRPDLGW